MCCHAVALPVRVSGIALNHNLVPRQGAYLLAVPLVYELVVAAATGQLLAALVHRDAAYHAALHRPAVIYGLAAVWTLQLAAFVAAFGYVVGGKGLQAAGVGLETGSLLHSSTMSALSGQPLES